MTQTQQEEFLRYDLERSLFGEGEPATPIWHVDTPVPDMINVEAYAKLRTKRDLYRVFLEDKREVERPQNEWFSGFCRAWNRFERNHPFLMFPFSTNVDAPIRAETKTQLRSKLRYTEWYYLRFRKRVPLIITITTHTGKGYYKPHEDEPGFSHQAVLLVLPLEPFKRYQLVNIDTAGWTDHYTAKWRDEVFIPLCQIINDAFARFPRSRGIQAVRSRPVEPVFLHQNLQDHGSCSAFSFMLALEIVLTPHARWQDAVERLHQWSWTVGLSAARRRMGTFLANTTKVFVYLARLLVRTKKRIERKQRAPYRWLWQDLFEDPIARQLWRQEYGPKIKRTLDTASFLRSEALLGPTAPQLRRMHKLHRKVRDQVNRTGKVTITKVSRGLKRLKKRPTATT